ncbi:MAG: PilZ domain-containing protein [Gallionella sp.]
MSNDTTPKKNHAINFPTLKLKAGTWLNLRSQGVGVANCQVEYVAALHGRSILVAQPASTTSKRGLLVGDHYLVRGFNGTSEFTFTSEVSALQSEPFAYAHLTYPDLVEVLVVREALRVNVSIPVAAMPDGATKHIFGTVKNLSVIGAMIESAAPLGSEGDKIDIAFSANVEKREVDLKIPAVIRNVGKKDAGGVFRNGLEFQDVANQDKLVLYYLLYIHSENV